MSTTTTAPPSLPKIKIYSNHGCGWSQRVHITLRELKLPYEEVLIDLDGPRPDWVLELNPRGLVPVLQYTPASSNNLEPPKTITLTESALIVTFLTSLHSSHLTPSFPPSTEEIHKQYLISFLIDTYFTKINPLMFKLVGASTPEAQASVADSILTNLKSEIEPLLIKHIKTPSTTTTKFAPEDITFFHSDPKTLTLAEIHIAPFTLRLLEFCNDVIFPLSLRQRIETDTPLFYAWSKKCMANEHVWEIWGDSAYWIARIEERLDKAKAKYADA